MHFTPDPQPTGVPFGAETSGGSSLSLVTPRGVKGVSLVTPGQGVSRTDIRVAQSPSDCIRRSVLPLAVLRPDVSGPPSLTPCVSEVVRQTPPRSLTAPVWQRAGSPDLRRPPARLGSLSAASGSSILPERARCVCCCLKQTRWGAGPGPQDREWCVLTWRIGVGLGEHPTSLDGR